MKDTANSNQSRKNATKHTAQGLQGTHETHVRHHMQDHQLHGKQTQEPSTLTAQKTTRENMEAARRRCKQINEAEQQQRLVSRRVPNNEKHDSLNPTLDRDSSLFPIEPFQLLLKYGRCIPHTIPTRQTHSKTERLSAS